MEYEFVQMNLEYAEQMNTWEYNGHVKTIYVEPYLKSLDDRTGKITGPEGCEGFAVLAQNTLVGLFEYYFKEEILEIGLGLNPDLVEQGHGEAFVKAGIAFGIKNYNYKQEFVKLDVDINNNSAIRVYKKAGFKEYKREADSIMMRKMV